MKYLKRTFLIAFAALVLASVESFHALHAQQLRSLGIDVSAWQGNISTANWSTLKRATNQQVGGVFGDGRDFVMIRSSRGGTTGYYDQNDPNNVNGLNTYSQRYDDPYYVQNINRAIGAGLFAGTYHFARPDIITTTPNSGGIANTGSDEADHMIQMAGPWLRPGFLPPVLDLETGDGIRTDNEMAQFCLDFSDRLYQVMGIRPAIYINGNYAANILQTATPPLPAQVVAAFPVLWSARWPNQSDPNSILVQTANPKDTYTPIYGPWDDPPNPTHPWKFWQYASTAHVNAIGGGASNCDVDVAQGGIEFLKDNLIPAVWLTDADGLWTTLSNWNSGQTPVTPVQGPGQVARVGPLIMPVPALPGSNDTVILDRPFSPVTITLGSGTQNLRKLYMREALNITGGALLINYVPSWDSTPISAQFSGPVTLAGSASLSVHTLQVDGTRVFTISGGTFTFNTLNLMPGTTPAKLSIAGDANFNSFTANTATITNGTGTGSSGLLDLSGAIRAFNVSAPTDLVIQVPVSNGGIIKTGSGTMHLNAANTYAGGTTVNAGKLVVNNTAGSGTGGSGVIVNGGVLSGTGTIAGAVTVNSGGIIYPGTGIGMGKLSLLSAPILIGTTFVKIDRNNGSSLSDSLSLSSGTLTYSGTLVVSNAGSPLIGGEVFTNFLAQTFSGAFSITQLPPLNNGLNWYLGALTLNGSLKVNRSPVTNPIWITNTPGAVLRIPIASLTANATDLDGDPITLTSINLTTTNGVILQSNAVFLVYSNYLNVPDSITYTISDGHGGLATGVVQIVASTAGQFLGQPNVSSSSVTLHFAGGPGMTYFVERSTNMPVWLTISTNVMPPEGVLDFLDDFHSLTEPPAAAFYRLKW